jgi:hypothetical protein
MKQRLIGSPWLTIGFLVIALVFTVFYARWAVDQHAAVVRQQTCAAYHRLATAKGATTPYDQTIKATNAHLFRTRCS